MSAKQLRVTAPGLLCFAPCGCELTIARGVEQQSEPDYGFRTTGGAKEWLMTRLLALSKLIKTPTILERTPMQVFEPHCCSALCSSSCLSWR